MKKRLFSTPPQAGARAPAMALMEVLVAAIIMGGVLALFFDTLLGARTDLARARSQALAVATASSVLAQAQRTWPNGPRAGRHGEFDWRLECAPSRQARSPRLVLVACVVEVSGPSNAQASLQTAWAAPSQVSLQP